METGRNILLEGEGSPSSDNPRIVGPTTFYPPNDSDSRDKMYSEYLDQNEMSPDSKDNQYDGFMIRGHSQMSERHSSDEGESFLDKINNDVQETGSLCDDSDSSELPYNDDGSETEGDNDDSISDQPCQEKGIPEDMFECQLCKVLLDSKESLKAHVRSQHSEHPDLAKILEEIETNDAKTMVAGPSHQNSITTDGEVKNTVDGTQEGTPVKKKRRKINHEVACTHPGCGKVFHTAGALKTHQVCHEIMKECIHCGAEFGTATAVIRHIDRRHNPKNIVQLPCTFPNCNEVFRHQTVLDKHLARHARESKTCSHCNQSFSMKRQLSEHIKQVHSADAQSQQLVCQNCGIPMADKESLIKHMSTTCVLAEGIVCEFDGCGEIFYSRQSLQSHRRRHMKSESETDPSRIWHYCPKQTCGQRFMSKKKLKVHLRITQHDVNVDELPFICLFRSCGLRFASKQDVISHMKLVHWGNKKREAAAQRKSSPIKVNPAPGIIVADFKCPACKERFKSDTKMRQHIKEEHAVDTSSADNQQSTSGGANDSEDKSSEDLSQFYVFNLEMFRCPVCHLSYHAVGRLRVHIESQHRDMGEEQTALLRRLDDDTTSFMDVVKTTLPRDCQYISKAKRMRYRRRKNLAAKLKGVTTGEGDESSKGNEGNEESDDGEGGGGLPVDLMMDDYDESDLDKLNTSDSNFDEEGKLSQDDSEASSSDKKFQHPDQFVCRYPSCGEKYACKTALSRHQKTHSRNLQCPHEGCKAEFFSMVNLRGHIKFVHSSAEFYHCSQCGRVGKGSGFKKHMKHCKNMLPVYICEQCGQCFPKKSSYTNHLNSHKVKVQKCDKVCTYEGCTKSFKSNQDLKRHLNVHSGERPHKCPYGGCNKNYKQRPHLLVHLKTHSVPSDNAMAETFPCEFCGFPFKRRGGKLKHQKNSCVKGPNKEMVLAKIALRKLKASEGPFVEDIKAEEAEATSGAGLEQEDDVDMETPEDYLENPVPSP